MNYLQRNARVRSQLGCWPSWLNVAFEIYITVLLPSTEKMIKWRLRLYCCFILRFQPFEGQSEFHSVCLFTVDFLGFDTTKGKRRIGLLGSIFQRNIYTKRYRHFNLVSKQGVFLYGYMSSMNLNFIHATNLSFFYGNIFQLSNQVTINHQPFLVTRQIYFCLKENPILVFLSALNLCPI